MSLVTLLVRFDSKVGRYLPELLASLQAQTMTDWELVVVINQGMPALHDELQELLAGEPRYRILARPPEPLGISANSVTSDTFLGLVHADARLYPEALAQLTTALADPGIQVAYSDEERHNRWGHLSLHRWKTPVDGVRLGTQECLGHLTLIRSSWLTSIGGFVPRACAEPGHAVYLRLLRDMGAAAFAHVPEVLYQRRRDHRERNAMPQLRGHMTSFDVVAVQDHLQELGLPGQAYDVNGTLRIQYRWPRLEDAVLVVLVGEDLAQGMARLQSIRRSNLLLQYPNLTIRIVSTAVSTEANPAYREVAALRQVEFVAAPGTAVQALNQVLLSDPRRHAVVLQGTPVGDDWVRELGNHLHLPGVAWVGPRMVTGRYLAQPGIPGYTYAGWDWNTRGAFNRLAVPHQATALSPVAMALNLDTFRHQGGFDEDLPTLYGLAYGLALESLGLQVIQVPDAMVLVEDTPATPEELALFHGRFSARRDPFRLIPAVTFTG